MTNDFNNSENEKRFHIINGAENLVKYGIYCKPVLVDEETGKQYLLALELIDLLNDIHEENQALKEELGAYYRLFDNSMHTETDYASDLDYEKVKKMRDDDD